MMSVDNLPAQFPRESTEYFGSKLLPLLHDFVSWGQSECICINAGDAVEGGREEAIDGVWNQWRHKECKNQDTNSSTRTPL